MDLRTKSEYFAVEHYSFDFVTEMKTVHCAVRTESSNIIQDYFIFNPNIRFRLVWIIPPDLHNHLRLQVVLTRKNGLNLRTFQNSYIFRKMESPDKKNPLLFVLNGLIM